MHMLSLTPLNSYHIKFIRVIWGHRGQKVIFIKNVSTQTDYVALTHDLRIGISLTPSTKVITLKIHPGSFGVTGVKRSFSPKIFQLKQITTFDNIHYGGVERGSFEMVEIQLVDHLGINIPFRRGIVTVKLHFKRKGTTS